MLRSQDVTYLLRQEAFPLKLICMFVDGRKMTADMGAHIRYVAEQQVACSFFHRTSSMFTNAFNEVDWPHVHQTLNKEVHGCFKSGRVSKWWILWQWIRTCIDNTATGCSSKCPCCTIHVERAEHILLCPKEGRVEAFQLVTSALEQWLDAANTDPDLADSIVEYVQWRGTVKMEEVVWEAPRRFWSMGLSQDKIGWWRFLKGMI
jgi:hypothetical protein